MQSVQLLNMLDGARRRAANQARIVAETKQQHEIAVKNSMIATAKKLRSQLARQDMALALTNEEIREMEIAVTKNGDLLTPPNDKKK